MRWVGDQLGNDGTMNNRFFAILVVVAIATVAIAPVIANDRRSRAGSDHCGLLKKYDKKAKTCRWKY